MPATLTWDFPLPRTHTGALLGNGVQGLMVWGVEALNITVARAGFWDHRGGNLFASRTTYAEVRALLEAGDEAGLRRVFALPQQPPGHPSRPTQIGGGRLELRFAHGLRPVRAELDATSATLRVMLRNPGRREAALVIRQAVDTELAWVELDDAAHGPVDVRLVPTWEYVGAELAAVGCAPPETWQGENGGGFCQRLPDDPGLAVAWELRPKTTDHGPRTKNQEPGTNEQGPVTEASSSVVRRPSSFVPGPSSVIVIATALGQEPVAAARELAQSADLAAAGRHSDAWWAAYHASLPRVELPDAVLQHAWDYGVYKLAGLTMPGGVPAALQGPWMEEYQLPPWSNDYHFNINVQMIYMPCLATGRFEHLWPMWELILGWLPRLKDNATHFFGAPDALMMPHAVDDRCAAVGAFWTGMIDQACTAWMAQLAWLHYRYSGDERVLREVAWPLLSGAFNGYWAMLEELIHEGHEGHDGEPLLSLPVSVSPEYNAAEMNAWGRDATFQLAALHFLAATLPPAAELVGQPEDPRWGEVRRRLPPYVLAGPPEKPRIALWRGQDLDESHRHHAHLAPIYPFRTIDPADEMHAATVRNTLAHWIYRGAGLWSGWCVPWASVICARCGMPDAALAWLHYWKENFTNEGHGTLHNGAFPGMTLIWGWPRDARGELLEIMQIDAGMGAVTAVQELLVQCLGDTIAVLPGIPRDWRSLNFDGMWVEGGFRVGATVAEHTVREVRVESTRGGRLQLAHGITGPWSANGVAGEGPLLELDTQPGEQVVVRAG
jgi:alpha-L-fucosidase 2